MATVKKNYTGIPKLDSRIKLLTKLVNDFPESKYINNGFYTNKYIYIEDEELSEIPSEFKVLKDGYSKILNVKELKDKFVSDFRNRKYKTKKLDKKEFKALLTTLKRFSFEQIKIIDGKFVLYDSTGQKSKWKMQGETDDLKDIVLQFDYKLLILIFNLVNELSNLDITIYSSGTYLVIKFISTRSITIYARGVILIDDEDSNLEQKSLL